MGGLSQSLFSAFLGAVVLSKALKIVARRSTRGRATRAFSSRGAIGIERAYSVHRAAAGHRRAATPKRTSAGSSASRRERQHASTLREQVLNFPSQPVITRTTSRSISTRSSTIASRSTRRRRTRCRTFPKPWRPSLGRPSATSSARWSWTRRSPAATRFNNRMREVIEEAP